MIPFGPLRASSSQVYADCRGYSIRGSPSLNAKIFTKRCQLQHGGAEKATLRPDEGLCLAYLLDDLAKLPVEVGVGRFEFLPADHQRCAEDDDLRAQRQRFNRLRHTQTADGLHRDINRIEYILQIIERAETGDHIAFVKAGVHDDVIDAHLLSLARPAGFIGAEHHIAHDFFVIALRHLDLLNDAGVMRLAHDDDHIAASFEHHLGFQARPIHRLEIDDYRCIREFPPEGADGVQTFGEEQWRTDFEPVDAGLDRGAGEVQRFI